MQYDVKTPEEYLETLERDWRFDQLQAVRALILDAVPDDVTEGIKYKMLSYSDERGTLFHLNAQKQYVSLYAGDTRKVDPDGVMLQGLDAGKGCIRLKKSTSLSETGVEAFIRRAVDLHRQGVDTGC